ncbi:DUF6879 family protein [Streptomyces sp. NPDC001663]|uniref:DUF6879 family protein n=1 Tax=Streptomyces sp. NPDC001663 TaxID=3364597 RepID=UPI0036B86568
MNDDTFGSYFEEFEHTAWRLETRRGYACDRAGEKCRRYVETSTVPDDSHRPWHADVCAQVGQGKWFQRVRVVDTPPTLEQLFLLRQVHPLLQLIEDDRRGNNKSAEATALVMVLCRTAGIGLSAAYYVEADRDPNNCFARARPTEEEFVRMLREVTDFIANLEDADRL